MEPDPFCQALYPKLVGSLRLSFGPGIAVEDVAQESLVRALERWDKVAAMDYPEAWVFRVAFNLARSRFRRRRAEGRATERLANRPPSPGSADAADAVAVRAAVAGLAKRQRQAIVLRYYADLTVDQVAKSMNCQPGTVKAHLHQGLVALRAAGLTDSFEPIPVPGGHSHV